MAHMPLSSKRHIGIMTGNLPSWNACSCLHQLCMWWLLQCRGWVVFPDGLNGGPEPLVFNFKELPLWNVADVGESSQDPSMKDVDLGDNVVQCGLPLHLSRRPTWSEFKQNNGSNYDWPHLAAPSHSPSCNTSASRTQTPSADPGSSSPNRGYREFSLICENRTHHPPP